jgi:hypothetical protein
MKLKKSEMLPTAKDVTRLALDDAAALIELLRARVEVQRQELDSAEINWNHAGSAEHMAELLLDLASRSAYDGTADDAATRERVLNRARRALARIESVES